LSPPPPQLFFSFCFARASYGFFLLLPLGAVFPQWISRLPLSPIFPRTKKFFFTRRTGSIHPPPPKVRTSEKHGPLRIFSLYMAGQTCGVSPLPFPRGDISLFFFSNGPSPRTGRPAAPFSDRLLPFLRMGRGSLRCLFLFF